MDRRELIVIVLLVTGAALASLLSQCPDAQLNSAGDAVPMLQGSLQTVPSTPTAGMAVAPHPAVRPPTAIGVTPRLFQYTASGATPGFAPIAGPSLSRLHFPAAHQPLSNLVELLIELQIDRGPAADMLAIAGRRHLLLPVRSFLRLAEIATDSALPGAGVSGVLQPSGRSYQIDTEQGIAQVGEWRTIIDSEQLYWQHGELFVATDLLEALFAVRFRVSLSELTVSVRQTDQLPVVRRMERERRRAQSATSQRLEEESPSLVNQRRLVDGVVLDWAISSATESPLRTSGVELGLGAQVLGGSAVLRYEERRHLGQRYRTATGSWIRVWHDISWLRQVRVGEVLGTGPWPRLVQGAAITNSPFVRPTTFGPAALGGVLPPGWEVELFRGRQFLDVTIAEPDGRYVFDVPVVYGENPFDLVAYGPNGETVRYRRMFSIAAERFAAGQFEYGVGAGRCTADPCRATANLDLRYGIDNRWTVRGGFEGLWRDTLPNVWHAYASTVFQATPALAVFAEGVTNAQAAVRVTYAPSQDLQATVAHTAFFGDVAAPLVGSSHETHRTEASLFFRPARWNYATYGRLTALRSVGSEGSRHLVRALASGRFSGTRLDMEAAYERTAHGALPPTGRATVDVRYFQSYRGRLQWLRRTLARVEFRTDLAIGPVRVSGGLSHGFRVPVQVDAGVAWEKGRGLSLELGLTATLRAVRAVSRNQIAPDGARGVQAAEGSVLWDGAGHRVAFADGRSLGRAGITGVVFHDVDADGTPDPDEMRVEGVLIRAGPIAVRTDAEGRFAVWDLVPFEPVVLEVAEESIRDPLLIAARRRVVLRPDPNSFTPIPVSLVRAGEVTGQVVVDPNETPLRGVTVLLRNLDTGDEFTAKTFSDGAFYLLGVRPGRYAVSVPDDVLDLLDLLAEPAQFEIGATLEAATADNVLVRLRPQEHR